MVNSIFILNKDKVIVDILSNNGDNPKSPFFEDKYVQHLATGAETFEFSTFSNERTSEYCEVGAYVAFKVDTKVKMFQIVETNEEHSEGQIIKSCYCEIGGLELINYVVRTKDMPSVNPTQFFQSILQGTSWSLGLVDMMATRVISTKVEKPTNAYTLIQDHLQDFGIEIEFRVELQGQRVVGQYIDIHKARGRETRKRFEYGFNVSGVSKTIDISNLCTAMIGVGKGGLNFKEVEWLSDKPAPKPLNQDFIVNPQAYEQWNRKGDQLLGVYENTEIESPDELLLLTWNALVEASVPKFTYDVATEMIKGDEESINIGDTVYVIDNEYTPALHLSARVGQLEISFTDHTRNKCVLTNFKDVKSGILSLETIQAIIDGKFPITGDNIANGTITEGNIGQGQITGLLIKAEAIETKHLTAGSVKADQIAAGAITAEKLTTGELITESAQIKEGIIGSAQIGDAVINTVHIEDGSINSVKIQDAAIGTAQIADASITNAKIGDLAVENANIKDLNAEKITTGQLSADVITANVINAINASIGKIDADHIDVESLVVDNIDAGKITTGTLDADRIKASVISAVNASIESATIDQAKIGELDAGKITTGSLDADRIQAAVINAINISTDTATINSAKIGNLDASKITTGTLNADRIGAESITAEKIDTEVINSISVNASEVVADKIEAGEIKVSNANILDGTISGAKITNASITNAQISNAFIADAYIKNLNADKITSGILNTTKVAMNSTSGALSIADNTIQIKDNQITPKVRVQIGKDSKNNYGILVMNAQGKAIFDSDKGVLVPEGLANSVVSEDKIVDEAVSSSKLQVDEIWASEGFVANFKAQEIDAGKITTGQISGERIDITGLVSFGSFNTDLKESFTQTGDKTFINGGNILTNSITANKINTRGFTATDDSNRVVFNIAESDGKVSVKGQIESYDFDEATGVGYRLTPEGDAIFNNATVRGEFITPDGGISSEGISSEGDYVRFWAGSDYSGRDDAPFRVMSSGKIIATRGEFGGTFTGKLQIGNIYIEDTNNSKGSIDIKTNNDTDTIIHLEEDNSYINSNLSLGTNLLNADITEGIIDIGGRLNLSNGNYSTQMNNGSRILDTTDTKGSHIQGYWDGIYLFNSYGDQENPSDFRFEKNSGASEARVDIQGELQVRNKITSSNNDIAIVMRSDEGNSGFDYIVK